LVEPEIRASLPVSLRSMSGTLLWFEISENSSSSAAASCEKNPHCPSQNPSCPLCQRGF
jgi:hypothetical protein